MSVEADGAEIDAAHRLLKRLADDRRPEMAAETVAVVVAHSDDETIGIGAQLPRLRGVTIVHVTDGAPRSMTDALAHGFATAEQYAAARRRELEAAMRLAGVPPDALVALGVPDQDASARLAEVARRLADLIAGRGFDVVVTHAYEGGHPDHDACAFAVHAAAALVAREGRPPGIVEMPLYSAGPDGRTAQRFLPLPGAPEVTIPLSEEERRLKRRMYDAHETQRAVLEMFSWDTERFRAAPPYDFTALPNGGRLLYEQHDWGMTGARWSALVRAALAELDLEPGPWP
jgi:LmbE family N-acetylglucosaminyl deacetylase